MRIKPMRVFLLFIMILNLQNRAQKYEKNRLVLSIREETVYHASFFSTFAPRKSYNKH